MVDFERMNRLKFVIEHDFDVRSRQVVPSAALLPLRWTSVVNSILNLPVAAWDCPTTAAGEIDTERKTKMWNQNNGSDDVYGRLNNTKEVGGARYFFIEDGQHKLALAVLEEFQHSSDGPSARAILKVLQSPSHPVGSFVVKIWKLCKPPFKAGMVTEADEFADFCRKLKGAPAGHPIGNDIRVLMKERPLDQLARGTVIDCNGVQNKKGNYVKTYWSNVVQSPQEIAAMRQRVEAEGLPSSNGPTQPPQMPQTQYGQQPPQGYQQPPQPGPMQYVQQPAQPQGVPQGGFLANVPTSGGTPTGNGGQGGSW